MKTDFKVCLNFIGLLLLCVTILSMAGVETAEGAVYRNADSREIKVLVIGIDPVITTPNNI